MATGSHKSRRGMQLPTGKTEIQWEFMLGFQNLPLFIRV